MTRGMLDRIAWGFTLLVVASIGVALAGLTWRILGDPGTRFDAVPVAAVRQAPVDLAPLIAWQPFGTAAPGGALPAADAALSLRGIWWAEPASASAAMIAVGDQPPQPFGVGAQVGTATIDAIERDHLVLLAGGRRSILAFPQGAAGAGGAPPPVTSSSAPVASAMAQQATSAPPPPPGTAPNFAPGAGGGGAGGGPSSAPLQAMSLLSGLGASASGDGYTVGPQPSPAMRMAGLQAGDVITAVNGNPVSAVLRDRSLLQAAAAGGTARLDVTRGSRTLALTIPLR